MNVEDYVFIAIVIGVIALKVLNHFKIINYKTSDLIEDLAETVEEVEEIKEEVEKVQNALEEVVKKGGKSNEL